MFLSVAASQHTGLGELMLVTNWVGHNFVKWQKPLTIWVYELVFGSISFNLMFKFFYLFIYLYLNIVLS